MTRRRVLPKNATVTEEVLSAVPSSQWRKIVVKDEEEAMAHIEEFLAAYDARVERVQKHFENKVEKVQRGDDFAAGRFEDGLKSLLRPNVKFKPAIKLPDATVTKRYYFPCSAVTGYAVYGRRYPGRYRIESAGCAFPYERRTNSRKPTSVGRPASWANSSNEMCEQYKRGEKTIDELNGKLKKFTARNSSTVKLPICQRSRKGRNDFAR